MRGSQRAHFRVGWGNCYGFVQSPAQGVTRKSKVSQSQRVTDIKGGYLVNGKTQVMAVDLLVDSGLDLTLFDIETFNSVPEKREAVASRDPSEVKYGFRFYYVH